MGYEARNTPQDTRKFFKMEGLTDKLTVVSYSAKAHDEEEAARLFVASRPETVVVFTKEV
jgi:hypothetical protein